MPTEVLEQTYQEFRTQLVSSGCSKCPSLCQERHTIVVDRGNPNASIVVIGEAPGEQEDLEGRAFVGRSGKLLDQVMASIGLDTNKDVLIINVVKCRPPKNRAPVQQEADNCRPYLLKQLELVNPKMIVLLGATAAKHLMPKEKGSNMKDRVGRVFELNAFPTAKFLLLYHPAYILRDPRKRKDMDAHANVLKRWLEEQ